MRHFETAHLHADLKGRSIRGGAVTLGAQGIKFALQLGSTMVLARLLTPADFGLVAMVTALTGFVAMFKDAGLSMATVQREEISHEQVSTLFWINVALSLVLMAVVAALAPAVVWFYGKPELFYVTIAIAGTFIFSGLSVQHLALLKRQMRFTALAIKDVLAMTAGVAVAVTLAWVGAGYWALIAMSGTSALAGMIAAWYVSKWLPGLPRRGTGVRQMLAFGGFLSASALFAYVRRNLDNVLIGAAWGPAALGLYQRAYGLLMLPIRQVNGPVTSIVIPGLSRLQNDPSRFRNYYCTAMMAMAAVALPVVTFATVKADHLIYLVLGPGWSKATPIFLALAPAALMGTLNVAGGWVFVSTGRTDRQAKVSAAITVVTVVAFLAGLPWGALGVAVAFSVAFVGYMPFVLAYAFHGSPVRLRDLVFAIALPLHSSTAALMAVFAMHLAVPSLSPLVSLAVDAPTFSLAYCLGWLTFPSGRKWGVRLFNDVRLHLLKPARA